MVFPSEEEVTAKTFWSGQIIIANIENPTTLALYTIFKMYMINYLAINLAKGYGVERARVSSTYRTSNLLRPSFWRLL